jgi:hypothetical protein
MLIPSVNNEALVFFRKFFGSRQLLHFEALGFAKLDVRTDQKYGFAIGVPHVNVDRRVLVAAEKEPEPVFFENLWHTSMIARAPALGQTGADQQQPNSNQAARSL